MITAAAFAFILLGAAIKGIIGIGLPMIAIPMLTLVVGLQDALAIVALPMLVANAWQVWQFRNGGAERVPMGSFLLSGAVGLALGTWLLARVPGAWLEMMLGLLLVAYLYQRLASPDLTLPKQQAVRLAPVAGFSSGALHGATGISGPIGITYFHSMRQTRPDFIYCTGLMFLGFTVIQVPMLATAGLLTTKTLLIGLICIPAVILGLTLGNAAASRVDARLFDRLVFVVLLWTSLSLLWPTVSGWLGIV